MTDATAILSVYDKSNLLELAQGLHAVGIRLLGSGGTAKKIRDSGIPIEDVAHITRAPEMLGGRVKTLHPAVHGGILARDIPSDQQDLKAQGIAPISIVVCNLYPFEDAISKASATLPDAVEEIDICGVTLLRAAAKNHERVSVLSNPTDYAPFLAAWKKGHGDVGVDMRRSLALKAFEATASYDEAISGYFRQQFASAHLGDQLAGPVQCLPLRYGANPRPQGSRKVSSPSQGSTPALENHAEIKNLRGDNQSLRYELEQAHLRIQLAEAQKSVAEAHVTIRALENQQLQTQLHRQSEKKKRRRLNTSACLLTAPEAESEWRKQNEKEVQAHEQEEQKKAEKTKTAQACDLQRMENAHDKVFELPLASYKLKGDLRDIAAALQIAEEGTIVELFTHIKKYLEDHPAIAGMARFSGLAQDNRRGRKRVLSVSGGATAYGSGIASGSAAAFPPGPSA